MLCSTILIDRNKSLPQRPCTCNRTPQFKHFSFNMHDISFLPANHLLNMIWNIEFSFKNSILKFYVFKDCSVYVAFSCPWWQNCCWEWESGSYITRKPHPSHVPLRCVYVYFTYAYDPTWNSEFALFMYRDASHLWRSFCHNNTKILKHYP